MGRKRKEVSEIIESEQYKSYRRVRKNWSRSPVAKIEKPKKGKGTYNRQKQKCDLKKEVENEVSE